MAKKFTQSIVVKNSFNTSDTTANVMVENNISYVPKISVIMPVYNGELYLRECLDSVINQTLREIEIICVDDGSTDGSLEILREYAKQDERITILTQQNLYAGVARNAGLVVARGEYIIFLDCDDFFELNMLQDMYDMATQDKSDIVVCGHHIYDDKNKRIKISRKSSTEIFNKSPFAPSEIKGDLLSFVDPAPWNKLYRKSLLMDNDIRFSALRICNDLTCVSTLFAVSSKISVLNNYYIYYRTNFAKQLSSTRSKHLDCFVAAFNELIENLRRFKVLDIYKETLTNRINSSLKYELSNCNMADRQVFMELLWNTLDKELLEILYVLPKICVIVPVYNVEEYLAKCLDSVINQTYKNLEIICVNDGSTDASAKILDEYAKKDCRIKIINQKNQGLSAARNTGMSNCTSEYVYFLDSDDYIAPETIDLLYIEMIRNDADTSFAGVVCFGDGIVEKSAVVSKQQWFDKFIKKTGVQPVPVDIRSEIVPTAWNKLYKMSIIKKHNIQFPVGLINEDEYWLWAYMIHCKKYVNINVPTYYYLQRANSIMGTCAASTKCLDIIEIFKRIYETILSQDKMGQYSGMMKPLLSLYINNTLNKLPSECYGAFVEKLNSIAAMSNMSKDVAGVCEKITSKYTADVLEILSDKAPTVSVIMPVYNAEKYLRESMNCLMRQTLCNIEIICVNDCSTDGSLDILREYANVNPRVKIINNKNNIGSAASRNVALSVARGMYIGFIDSDDLINNGYFMNLFAASKYGQYDIGATGVVTLFSDDCDDTTRKNVGIHEKEYVISGDTERAKIIVSTGVSWNKIYKKSFLDANNIKCLEIKNAAEDNYFTDLAVMFADKIGVTSKSEYFYRQNPVSQTKVLKGKKDIQMFDVYSKILEFVKQNKTENRDFWIDTIYKRAKSDFWTFFDTMNYECHDDFIRAKRQFFGNEPQIVVSLTSYPARIDKVSATINSIINQTMRPDRIVLALGEDKFLNKEADLPSELLELRGRGLEILWCKDIRSYTKLLPALKKYPDDIIITVDDDCMYDTDLVRMLYENHRKYPSDILCHRAHEVILKHGYPIPYKKWGWEKYGPSASYRNFLTGVGGVLYPPHSLPDMVFDESEFMSLCPRADDIWFWAMAVLNNKKIRIIKHNKQHPKLVDGTQDTGLMHSNVGNDGNDKQLAELLKKYPELLKRIRHVPLYESCKYKHSEPMVILFGHHIAKVKIKPYILFPYYLLAMIYMRYVKLPFARIKTALHRTEMHNRQIQDIMKKLSVLQNQNKELQQQLHDMQKLNTSCDNESN